MSKVEFPQSEIKVNLLDVLDLIDPSKLIITPYIEVNGSLRKAKTLDEIVEATEFFYSKTELKEGLYCINNCILGSKFEPVESDAVEFAEWVSTTDWSYEDTNRWYKLKSLKYKPMSDTDYDWTTTQELYNSEEFKQFKQLKK